MRKLFELTLAEAMTLSMAIVVVLALGFSVVVSAERKTAVAQAQASIGEAQAITVAAVNEDGSVSCDNALVDSGLLSNEFIPLDLQFLSLRDDSGLRAPAIYVKANRETDGGDTFASVEMLYETLDDSGEYSLTHYVNNKEDKAIEYAVLLAPYISCSAVAS